MKLKKPRRYHDYDLIPTSHLLDSIWVKKDMTAIKIVFATGQVLDFKPIETKFAKLTVNEKENNN